MCNEHDHYQSRSTEEYNNLCFRHAVLEALQGRHVTTSTETYSQGKTECDICLREAEAILQTIKQGKSSYRIL